MKRYSKSLVALIASLATAAALLPTDAPVWLLGVGVAVQSVAVYLAPRNAPRFEQTTSRAPRGRAY